MTKQKKLKESPLFWPAYLDKNMLMVLDETLIPDKLQYVKVRNVREAVHVIRQMKTRAFGQFLVVLNTFQLVLNTNQKSTGGALLQKLKVAARRLNNSRPTFPFAEVTANVIRWAETAVSQKKPLIPFVKKNIQGYLAGIKGRRLDRVQKIAAILKNGDSVLTHCNVSGELAMAAHVAQNQGKEVHFFATETRPYMQGAKLTCWELKRMGAMVTLVADNAVGSLMADGLVNKVIVGSDRSCANGDFANKIGTYQIAVLAEEFDIPFYVLTQPSSKIKSGEEIPIEIRQSKELLVYSGKKYVWGAVDGFYPGFDVVPHQLIKEAIAIDVH